jgi:hypothetical protein
MNKNAKSFRYLFNVVCAVVVSVGASALPAHAAKINVVHGIDGRDLGTSQALPVDIAVNGSCALTGIQFKQQTTVELGVGSYAISVHPSDGSCSNAPVIEKTLTIGENDDARRYTAVASLTGKRAPQLAVFETGYFGAAVEVRHLAAAGGVSVDIRVPGYRAQRTPIRNGKIARFGLWARALRYRIDVFPGASRRAIVNLSGSIRNRQRNFYIVGSAQNGFTIISEDIVAQ